MDQLIQIQDLTFTYPAQQQPVLKDINLTVNHGDFIVIAGDTGSGKTTLLNHLKKELIPAGETTGDVLINGKPIKTLSQLDSAQTVGYVAQNPQTQPIMSTVIEELAFPLENVGCPSNEIERRIAELSNYLGLDQLLDRQISELSGGQLQLANLASVLILRPKIILLDEPTSQLDPLTTQHFFEVLRRVHEELGITIILSEHHLSIALSLANRMLLIQHQTITFDGPPTEGIKLMGNDERLGYFIPPVSQVFLAGKRHLDDLPISVAAGQRAIRKDRIHFKPTTALTQSPIQRPANVILKAKNIQFSFDRQKNVVDHLDLNVHQGDWLAIIGKNGAGKSTLLNLLTGLRTPQHGKVYFNQKVVWKIPTPQRIKSLSFLSQTPTLQFRSGSVYEQLTIQARELALDHPQSRINAIVDQLKLQSILKHNPFDISGGQQQLLGLAIALLAKPTLLILDEPTKGLDPFTKNFVGNILKQVQQAGTTIIMASHDMGFCATFADHCAFMFDGHINTYLPTRNFFTHNFFFTTSINRLVRNQVPEAMLARDIELNNASNG
ncbi:ABC transporter ATP-binding protein [Lentilactobacillus diolivorans]|uniref:ABC transporter, ATP-binding protein n=2 Tax=Lentilactobacillus diolivorans TaxID=179838 RepID=A0A0R1S8B5_9LACO|nr:ABC transporter ATP-binding protein [Lentilactobacillus diolivorans]KRL62488.1 ABC transporter, ATP-binding protein [Lentilactobacillus diolivorans DSM 14421]GEP25206.1 putative ABC transporter ATP-binding protein [Lentilactobacillus diolivorans]